MNAIGVSWRVLSHPGNRWCDTYQVWRPSTGNSYSGVVAGSLQAACYPIHFGVPAEDSAQEQESHGQGNSRAQRIFLRSQAWGLQLLVHP